MDNEAIGQIRSVYGEILGIADHLPSGATSGSVVDLYNDAIDRLNQASGEDYNRFKVTHADVLQSRVKPMYGTSAVRPKMTGVLSTLEYKYGFRKTQRGEPEQQPTTIVTINNNNQLSVTVIPIQQILEKITDEELRKLVEELKAVIEGDKDKKRASDLLNTIQQKSWDVFIALLPIVLERLGS